MHCVLAGAFWLPHDNCRLLLHSLSPPQRQGALTWLQQCHDHQESRRGAPAQSGGGGWGAWLQENVDGMAELDAVADGVINNDGGDDASGGEEEQE